MANYDLTYEGSRVQGILDTGNSLKDAGYIFRGEATPSTVPGTPTERVAYIGGPGTYTNFGGSITVPVGRICVFKYTGSAWSNQVIDTRVSDGAAYKGIATPTTNPGSPIGSEFYLAVQAGTYTNFGSLTVTAGINILKYNGSTWSVQQAIAIDAEPTQGSANLVKSGGVLNSIIQNGSAFDLSAYNAQGGVLATYADLSAALTALNALPADFKKGGMSMKFVLSSDNKYVQWRLLSNQFTTDIEQWQNQDLQPIEDKVFGLSFQKYRYGGNPVIGTTTFNDLEQNLDTNWEACIADVKANTIITLYGNTGTTQYYWFLYVFSKSTGKCIDALKKQDDAYVEKTYNEDVQIVVNSLKDEKHFVFVNDNVSLYSKLLQEDEKLLQNDEQLQEEIDTINQKLIHGNVVLNENGNYWFNSPFSVGSPESAMERDTSSATMKCAKINLPAYTYLRIISQAGASAQKYMVFDASTHTMIDWTKTSNLLNEEPIYLVYNVDTIVYLNATINYPYFIQSFTVYEQGEEIHESAKFIQENQSQLDDLLNKSIILANGHNYNNGVAVGSVVDDTLYNDASYKCAKIECKQGDTFTINGRAGVWSIVWSFTDVDRVVLSRCQNDHYSNNEVIIAPENAAYLYVNISTDSNPFIVRGGRLSLIENNLKNGLQDNVLSLNDRVQTITEIKTLKPYLATGVWKTYDALTLLHFSDIHADTNNFKRIIEFWRNIITQDKKWIDDVICTGDFVLKNQQDGMTWFDNVAYSNKVLLAIGNHEVAVYTGTGPDEGTQYDALNAVDTYVTYFKTRISNWGVTQPSDAENNGYCFYYKDYADNKVRLIVLDGTHFRAADSYQTTWFTNTMDAAKELGYAVAVAIHYPFYEYQKVDCTFNPIGSPTESPDWCIPTSFISAVDAFKQNGGIFSCWLCGHMHQDMTILHNNQLCISIGAAAFSTIPMPFIDGARFMGEKSQDLFNIVSIDQPHNRVVLKRIGCDINRNLITRRHLVIDYLTNDVIFND